MFLVRRAEYRKADKKKEDDDENKRDSIKNGTSAFVIKMFLFAKSKRLIPPQYDCAAFCLAVLKCRL